MMKTKTARIEEAKTTTDEVKIKAIITTASPREADLRVISGLIEENKIVRGNDDFAKQMQDMILDGPFAQKDYNYMAAREIAMMTQIRSIQERIIDGEGWLPQLELAKSKHLIRELQPSLAHRANHMDIKLALLERADLSDNVKRTILEDKKVAASLKQRKSHKEDSLAKEHAHLLRQPLPESAAD
jgi:hypothetical protein